MPIKSKYRIVYLGEGDAQGIVELTPEEFEIVRRVLDVRNWEAPHFEGWSPKVFIEPYHGDGGYRVWGYDPDKEREIDVWRDAYGI